MLRAMLVIAALLGGVGCESFEEEGCPQCTQECWEGDRPCTKCKEKHGCPLNAAPDDAQQAEVDGPWA